MLERLSRGEKSVISKALEIVFAAGRRPLGNHAPLIRSLMAYYILGNNMIHNFVWANINVYGLRQPS